MPRDTKKIKAIAQNYGMSPLLKNRNRERDVSPIQNLAAQLFKNENFSIFRSIVDPIPKENR